MIIKELVIEDTPGFSKYMRIPHAKFVTLVEMIAPFIVKPVPFLLTGDETFPLSKHMLKPYLRMNLTVEERIANFRI